MKFARQSYYLFNWHRYLMIKHQSMSNCQIHYTVIVSNPCTLRDACYKVSGLSTQSPNAEWSSLSSIRFGLTSSILPLRVSVFGQEAAVYNDIAIGVYEIFRRDAIMRYCCIFLNKNIYRKAKQPITCSAINCVTNFVTDMTYLFSYSEISCLSISHRTSKYYGLGA